MSRTISSPKTRRSLAIFALAAPLALSACSTQPNYDRDSASSFSGQQRLRANCELPRRVSKLGNTAVVDARQRVFASRADCERQGGDMLAIAD